jgi:hypothetical protein
MIQKKHSTNILELRFIFIKVNSVFISTLLQGLIPACFSSGIYFAILRNRLEFENRAILLQYLNEFKRVIKRLDGVTFDIPSVLFEIRE